MMNKRIFSVSKTLISINRKSFYSLHHPFTTSSSVLSSNQGLFDRPEVAVWLFPEMLREGLKPIQFTLYPSVLKSAGVRSVEREREQIHGYCLKNGFDESYEYVTNAVVDLYCKYGRINKAHFVFDRLDDKNIVDSWNSKLNAYAKSDIGGVYQTLTYFQKMMKRGIIPNAETFLCVLMACSDGGLLTLGQRYFEMMKDYNIEPEVSHYVTMVDLLGRVGQVDEAVSFIKEMPIQPTEDIFTALIRACRMHKNIDDVYTYAAERMSEVVEPCDSVRKVMMKEFGVKNQPACSWVVIENCVNMFVANDEYHPMKDEIYKMWGKVCENIKQIGYVPKTNVLYDQHEKEAILLHGEKLALAFALLKTPSGSYIKILKNLRMCLDCHSAFKFVSLVEERVISLRDANRYHHFRGGSCSCGDYW